MSIQISKKKEEPQTCTQSRTADNTAWSARRKDVVKGRGGKTSGASRCERLYLYQDLNGTRKTG